MGALLEQILADLETRTADVSLVVVLKRYHHCADTAEDYLFLWREAAQMGNMEDAQHYEGAYHRYRQRFIDMIPLLRALHRAHFGRQP